MKRLKNEPLLLVVILLIIAFALIFTINPIIQVVLKPGTADYVKLLTSKRWFGAILNSMFMTLVSTLSCTAIAFLFAYVITRLEVPCKRIFRFVTLLPIVSPPFIVALSYIILFGRQGFITKDLLGLNVNIYGKFGLWMVQTITFFPYAYAVLRGVLRSIPPTLEYAAYNMGASRWRAFKDVIFPLCRPGIAGGALVAAMSIITDFGNPMIIGGGMALLPTEAYAQIGQARMQPAAALATALLVPVLALFLVNRFWVGKRSYITITGKESSLTQHPIPKSVKWALFGLCTVFSALVLLVYGTLLYGSFAKLVGVDWSFTLKNYNFVWNKWDQVWNSMKFALLSSTLASVVAIVLAYIVQKKQIGINKTLDFIAVLPGAIPGMFLAIGYVMAFNVPPIKLTGTGTIIVIALLFWNLPTCYSAATAGLLQIGNSIEDAALNLGASSFRSFRDIILPLLKVPFLMGFVLSFLRSTTCLSIVIFLYTPKTVVGTISIMNLVNQNNRGSAAAFTVVLVTIAFSVLGIIKRVLKKQDVDLEI
jgi:iron(III) transport system permease protein